MNKPRSQSQHPCLCFTRACCTCSFWFWLMKAAIRTVSLFLPESRSNALRVPATLFLLSAAPKHSRGTLICPQIYSLCRDSCNFLGVLWAQVLIKKKRGKGHINFAALWSRTGYPSFFLCQFRWFKNWVCWFCSSNGPSKRKQLQTEVGEWYSQGFSTLLWSNNAPHS